MDPQITLCRLPMDREIQALNHETPVKRTIKWLKYVLKQENNSDWSRVEVSKSCENIKNFIQKNNDKLARGIDTAFNEEVKKIFTTKDLKEFLEKVRFDLKFQRLYVPILRRPDSEFSPNSDIVKLLILLLVGSIAIKLIVIIYKKLSSEGV